MMSLRNERLPRSTAARSRRHGWLAVLALLALAVALLPGNAWAGRVPWARRSVAVDVRVAGKPSVHGGLTPAAVLDRLEPLLDISQQCVKRGWEPRAPRKAKMAVQIRIDAKGDATRLAATLRNRLLRRIARCVSTRVGELRFGAPARAKPTDVRLQIAFEVKED